jgi:hypothetical protein
MCVCGLCLHLRHIRQELDIPALVNILNTRAYPSRGSVRTIYPFKSVS